MPSNSAIRVYHSGLLPFEVDVYLDTYDGPGWVRRVLRGRSGWLRVSRAAMNTPMSDWTETLVAAITDDGVCFGPFASSAFLDMRSSNPREALDDPDEDLDGAMEMRVWDFLGTCDLRHLRMLSEAEDEITTRVALEQARGERVLADADAHIAAMRRERRDLQSSPERRTQLADSITFFEDKQSAAAAWLVRRLASMREERVQFEADVFEALENHGEVEELFTVRWVARTAYDRVYSRAEGNFLMGGLRRPVRNRDAERLLRERRQPDEESEDDRKVRIEGDRERRRAKWDALRSARAVTLAKGEADRRAAEEKKDIAASVAAQRERDRLMPASPPPLKLPPPTPALLVDGRLEENRQRLRTAAQQESAKRRDQQRLREEAVDALLDQYPTVRLLDARLESIPSLGSENRRLARLIRHAIRRLSGQAGAADPHELASAGEQEGDA